MSSYEDHIPWLAGNLRLTGNSDGVCCNWMLPCEVPAQALLVLSDWSLPLPSKVSTVCSHPLLQRRKQKLWKDEEAKSRLNSRAQVFLTLHWEVSCNCEAFLVDTWKNEQCKHRSISFSLPFIPQTPAPGHKLQRPQWRQAFGLSLGNWGKKEGGFRF